MADEHKFPYPTEVIDLPSKGLIYPEDNPLSSGVLTLRYMTARDEDILTSQNLIQKGIVIDELLKSVIVDEINYNDLFVGDKNAIMIATRIFGYGKDYKVEVKCPACSENNKVNLDLTLLDAREVDVSLLNRENSFEYTLPQTKRVLTFKLLTHKDEKEINSKIQSIKNYNKKINKKDIVSQELSIRFKQMILAIDGDFDVHSINNFVDKEFLSIDTKEFRKHIKIMSPDIDMTLPYTCPECGETSMITMPMTVGFFWIDTEV